MVYLIEAGIAARSEFIAVIIPLLLLALIMIKELVYQKNRELENIVNSLIIGLLVFFVFLIANIISNRLMIR